MARSSKGYSLVSQEPEDEWEMVRRSSDRDSVRDKHCWMSTMPNIYKATLGQVVWPGTHDSGAYLEEFDCSRVSSEDRLMKLASFALRCLGRRAKRFASGWARAQQLSVKEQLEHGVRYLDLRVARCDRSRDYYITHSIGGPDLDDVLQQIAGFARKNSKEIILIRMCPRSRSVDHAELHEVVCRNLEELVLKKPQQELRPSPISYTLSRLLEEGRIVVFYASHASMSNPKLTAFWSPDCIHNPWSYSLDPREKEEFQLTQYKSFRTSVPRHTRLFNFQFVLTPTTKDVCKSLVYGQDREARRFSSLWDCAEHMNQRLGEFIDAVVQADEQQQLQEGSGEETGSGKIVTVDYIDRSELTDILVQMNRKYFGH